MSNSKLLLIGGVLIIFAIVAIVPLMKASSISDFINATNISIEITQDNVTANLYLNTAGTSFDPQKLTSNDINMADLVNQIGCSNFNNLSFGCNNISSITFNISDFLNAINGTAEIANNTNFINLTYLSVSSNLINLEVTTNVPGQEGNVSINLSEILPNITTINSELAANNLSVTSDRNIIFTKSGNNYTIFSDEGYGSIGQNKTHISDLISQDIGNITLHNLIKNIIPTTTSKTLDDFFNGANLNYSVTSVNLSNVNLEDGNYNVNVSISDGTNTYYKIIYLTLYGIQNSDSGTADSSGVYIPVNPNVYYYLENVTGLNNGTNVSVSLFDVFPSPAPPSNMLNVIKYINFSVYPDNSSNYTIYFKVPVDKITNHLDVFLYHLVNEQWVQLSTEYLSTDNTFDYYLATTPSFSMFMIMETTAPVATASTGGSVYGGRLILPSTQAPANPAPTPINAAPAPSTPPKGFFATITGAIIGALGTPEGIIATIFIVLVIGALIAVFIILRGKGKPEKGKKKE